MKGKLVVIDGTDGSGKTTQINLLSQYLKEKNINFEVISFPQYGKNEFANKITEYLEGKLNGLDIYEVAKYYAEDRKTVRDQIKNWLDSGKLVIANRYVSSSKAHLSANLPEEKREEFISWIDDLEYQKNDMPKEDLTILFSVDPKVGQKNVKSKHRSDIHEDNLKHLIEANKIYMKLSKKENWIVIDCMENGEMKSKEDIQKYLLDKISVLLSSK